jgi:hypothetical protein
MLTSSYTKSQELISGFFDLQQVHDLDRNSFDKLQFGQFEIGIKGDLFVSLSGEASISYNSEEQIFEPGSVLINYTIHKIFGEDNNTGVLVISGGLFDIPFGIDYKYIASPDRNLITPPLVVQRTINNINGTGLCVNYSHDLLCSDFYLTSNFNNSFNYGGRVGLELLNKIEIGSSILVVKDLVVSKKGSVYGIDLSYKSDLYNIQSEYIIANGINQGEVFNLSDNLWCAGFSAEFTYELYSIVNLPLRAIVRYGIFSKEKTLDSKSESFNRIAFGLASSLYKNLLVKIEYLNENSKFSNPLNIVTAQLVVSI